MLYRSLTLAKYNLEPYLTTCFKVNFSRVRTLFLCAVHTHLFELNFTHTFTHTLNPKSTTSISPNLTLKRKSSLTEAYSLETSEATLLFVYMWGKLRPLVFYSMLTALCFRKYCFLTFLFCIVTFAT